MNTLCLNRINKDLKEINKSPLEGIGIISLDNDPKKYIVNIKIMSGIFKGYCIQLLLTFPEQYPIKPPRILIYPGQSFDNTYHHHIFRSDIKDDKDQYFNKFCFDLLDNDFLPTSSEAFTGWNPSYTISTLLLQVQTFLANPDFPTGYIPNKQKIDELMKSMDNYEKSFIIKNDNYEDMIKIHTWNNPYPEMYFKNNPNLKKNIQNDIIENKENNKLKSLEIIKENLTCFVSKSNYIDNPNMILGYPLKGLKNGFLIPIPEIISYDCYIEESSKMDNSNKIMIDNPFLAYINGNSIFNQNQLFFYLRNLRSQIPMENIRIYINNNNQFHFRSLLKSANNEFYDSWVPIYINDEYFKKNESTILNSFSILKYGNIDLKNYDFHPLYIFEIMPNILGEMISKIIEKNVYSSLLICFFQIFLTYKKLEKKYNNVFLEYQKTFLNNKLNEKRIIEESSDIERNLMILLVLFLFCDNDLNKDTKEKLEIYVRKMKNRIILQLFKEGKISHIINKTSFIEDLSKYFKFNKLYYEIYFGHFHYIIFNDDFSLINKFSKDNIIKKIIENNPMELCGILYELFENYNNPKQFIELDLSKYVDITNLYNSEDSNHNLLKKSYEFILIIQIMKEKLLNENFLKDLENNFGIYLDTEGFLEELNNIKVKSILGDFNKLKKDLYFIIDLIILLTFYHNYHNSKPKYSIFTFDFSIYANPKLILRKEIYDLLFREKDLLNKYKRKQRKRNDFAKKQRDRIIIKNSYDKNYNKRFYIYKNKKIFH